METVRCQKHKLKKDYLFCLENSCRDRLVCEKCNVLDRKHSGHNIILLRYLGEDDQNELERIFSKVYIDMANDNKDLDSFIQMLDQKVNNYLDTRESTILRLFQQMILDLRTGVEEWKENQYQKLRQNDFIGLKEMLQQIHSLIDNGASPHQQQLLKQQIDKCNQINQIQQELNQTIQQIKESDDQMIEAISNMFQYQNQRQQMMIEGYDQKYKMAKKMYDCEDEIYIQSVDKNYYMQLIDNYENENKEYTISIEFSYSNNLQHHIEVIQMIDQLNANQKVGKVSIEIETETTCRGDDQFRYHRNAITDELLRMVIDRYHNIYHISIIDHLDHVNDIHCNIKWLVQKSTLLEFRLEFHGQLKHADDDVGFTRVKDITQKHENAGLMLLKQYNQIIKQQKYLKHLIYKHDRVNESTELMYQIHQIVDKVSQL